jgi:hypothetical protein
MKALEFQQAADRIVKHKGGQYGQILLPSYEWFVLSRHFITLLRKAASGRTQTICAMMDMLGVNTESLAQPQTGLAFEMLPIDERSILLENAWCMMQAGPDRYLDAARAASIAKSSLVDGRHCLPSCIDSIIRLLPDRNINIERKKRVVIPKQRSKQVVLRMWARLQRKINIQVKA